MSVESAIHFITHHMIILFQKAHLYKSIRFIFTCGDLMVRVLDSGSSGPGSGPGREHCVVYEWVPAKMLGLTLRWTSIPSRGGGGGGVEIPLVASCYKKPEISAALMGLLGS